MRYITDFHKSRERKIGASDIASCVPHPTRSESVAGYDKTALTVWQEKTGREEKKEMGIEARFGILVEPLILKLYIEKIDEENAEKLFNSHLLCELNKKDGYYEHVAATQNSKWKHHTEASTHYGVAHPDCLNEDDAIIIQAKSRSIWMLNQRREDNPYNEYDSTINGYQGIPLSDYIQTQYESALIFEEYGIKIKKIILAAMFDRSQFHYWEFKPNKKIQSELLTLAQNMKRCIDSDTPPRDFAMNAKDIKLLYPEIKDDFRIISGDEAVAAIELKERFKIVKKEFEDKEKKFEDLKNAMSIFLKDSKKIKAIIDGETINIATWTERAGYDKIVSLSEIKDKRIINFLKKNNLIEKTKESKSVKIY